MIATLVGAIPAILSALLFLVMWIFIFAAIAADKVKQTHKSLEKQTAKS
jgi:uncharacterized membrane protein